MITYILDTSAWYAFLNASDTFHQKAKQVIEQSPRLMIPYPVFEELVALMHHRLGKKQAIQFLDGLLHSRLVEIFYLSEMDNQEIWKMYQESYTYLDFVDCSVIWTAKKFKLPVFTFDEHFSKSDVDIL